MLPAQVERCFYSKKVFDKILGYVKKIMSNNDTFLAVTTSGEKLSIPFPRASEKPIRSINFEDVSGVTRDGACTIITVTRYNKLSPPEHETIRAKKRIVYFQMAFKGAGQSKPEILAETRHTRIARHIIPTLRNFKLAN